MFAVVRHFRRMLTVVRTFARYDTLFLLEKIGIPKAAAPLIRLALLARPVKEARGKSAGRRLALALTHLGPAFFTLVQAWSVRP